MSRVKQSRTRALRVVLGVVLAAATLNACIEEQPTGPNTALIPPEPPSNPEIVSAAWQMDVDRHKQEVTIKAPQHGLEETDLQLLSDYFSVAPASPDLSILAGDVVDIVVTPGTFSSSAVGAFVPGQIRTTFEVSVLNKISAVNLTTPTFPAPPAGTSGVLLFPFAINVTETPGGASTGGDGTDILVELPNFGLVAPSTDFDGAPFNFFNDDGCGPDSNDCYRHETFLSQAGTPEIEGGAQSESRLIGFDHDPTVSQFRARLIVAGDLADATPNDAPIADAGGPYSGDVGGAPVPLDGTGSSDPDGTIVAYDWDFDNDGTFDDASGATVDFTCQAPAGLKTVGLRVTDNRSATGTDTAEVDCVQPPNIAPIADAGGPYSGETGGAAVDLSGAGSSDPDGTIVSYEWDLDDDGVFDDATGVSASFACAADGSFPIALQVTDDGTPVETATDATTVECAAPAAATINGRWVDDTGAPITSTSAGSTVFLELDMELGSGNNVHDFQGVLQFDGPALTTVSAVDLNCSNPGGQADCPSGAPASGHTDVMNQHTANTSISGQINFLNFSINPDFSAGIGIQGLTRIEFTANASASPSLTVQVAVDGDGSNLNPAVNIPSLTVN